MSKSIIEMLVGNLEDKRAYRQFMKRVNALPGDYRFAFKKIQHYLYHFDTVSCDMTIFTDLVDLFEESAAENKAVLDVIGSDVAEFCDELIRSTTENTITSREKFNQEILEHFNREGKNNV